MNGHFAVREVPIGSDFIKSDPLPRAGHFLYALQRLALRIWCEPNPDILQFRS